VSQGVGVDDRDADWGSAASVVHSSVSRRAPCDKVAAAFMGRYLGT
jgi:hypothetical protein